MTPQIKQRIEQIRRGEVPDGYKRTKVGLVPEEWDTPKAKEIFSSVSDKKYNENLEVLSATQDRGVIPRSQVDIDIKYDKSSVLGYKKVSKGNYVISLRSFQGGIEYSEYDGLVSPAYIVLKEKREICQLFFKTYFKTDDYIKRLAVATYGIRDGKSISFEDFGTLRIPFPPLFEQKKIAEILQTQDKLIALQQKKIEELKKLKKAYLSKMFPKKGCNVPEIRFPGFTDPWEQRKFEEVFIERREKTEQENEDTLLSCAINGMFLNSELFGHFRGTTTIGYLRVKKNDLILSAQNLHLGNANVNLRFEHGIISPAYKVYDLNKCGPEFIQAWVKKDDTKNFFLAATTEGASQCRKNIEWETLGKQTIPMPSINEQKRIGAFFQQLDHLITLHQRKLEEMKIYKKSLMQLLLTGIVRTKGENECLSRQNR